MTRRLLPILLAGGIAFCGMATTLQPNEALARFMLSKPAKMPSSTLVNPRLEFTNYSEDGSPALYVFNLAGGNGYIMLSADDATAPLLGYSDKGGFNPDNVPAALKYWLEAYSRQISHMRNAEQTDTINGGGYTGVKLPDDWTPVAPLLTTTWNQTEPYNDLCPTYKGEKCVTGCVATAMAQAMNYFKYPEVGRDSIEFKAEAINTNLKYNFEENPFDWDNMLDDYIPGDYTEVQANAVAELMEACGMSVKMMYTPEMSGAYSQDIAGALIKYFNYDEGTTYLTRDHYSYTQWAELIYENLKNVGPVIYDGQAPLQGGHSFVCDGYDGNGYFHFNWGWAGLSDGYFLLDALTPEAIGTGGYYGGFSLMQDIVIGIQPPKGSVQKTVEERVTQYGSMTGKVYKDILYIGLKGETTLGWGYTGEGTAHFDFGCIIENVDNDSEPVLCLTSLNYTDIELLSGTYIQYKPSYSERPQFSINDLETLTPGERYKLTLVTKDLDWQEISGQEPEWLPVVPPYGYPNYIYITKGENNKFTIESDDIAMFTISNVVVPELGYYDKPLEFMLNISNDNDFELSRNICAMMGNEDTMTVLMSDSFLITLAPGETITYKWTSPMVHFYGPRPQNGQVYEFAFIDLGNMWDYEIEPVYITMEYYGAPVETLTADNSGMSLAYDKASNTLSVSSQYSLKNVTATAVNGITTDLPIDTNINSTSIRLESLGKGLWIIRATDSEGYFKTLKIML